jgi:hypothetical protein
MSRLTTVKESSPNGDLSYTPVPTAGPVKAIELRRRLLPSLPLSDSAMAAVGGFLAGAAALVTLRVARRVRWLPFSRRRGRRAVTTRSVVATRSFLVDVHLLER